MVKSVNRKSPGGVVGAVAASGTEGQALGSGLTAIGDSSLVVSNYGMFPILISFFCGGVFYRFFRKATSV